MEIEYHLDTDGLLEIELNCIWIYRYFNDIKTGD